MERRGAQQCASTCGEKGELTIKMSNKRDYIVYPEKHYSCHSEALASRRRRGKPKNHVFRFFGETSFLLRMTNVTKKAFFNVNYIVIILILFFGSVSAGLAVSAEPSDAELEFMVDSAREELKAQEESVKELREKYEAILKRKKEIQRFIDEESNKKVLPGVKKLKKQVLAASAVSVETPENIPETGINEGVDRKKAQEQAFAQLEKNLQCRPVSKKTKSPQKKAKTPVKHELSGEIKQKEPTELTKDLEVLERKKAARILEEEKNKKLAEQASAQQEQEELKRKKAEEQKQELSRKKEKQERQKLAEAKQKEQAALDKKLEQERLSAEEKENALIADRERQLKLLLEANNKAKHEKYVSDLKILEERQNNLLKQSSSFEQELNREEESLKLVEKKWAEAFQRLWEKLSEQE